ncbi:WD40-repeat-containing domain protein [Lipomyces kononenkoae]
MDQSPLSRYLPLTCTGHSRPVTHLSFSSIYENGSCLMISACKDGAPMLRDGVTGDWIGTFTGHKGAVWSASFSADAQLAITASADFTSKVWDTNSGSIVASYAHNHIVRTAAFVPAYSHAQFCMTAGNEKKIRIWDLNRDESAPAVMEWIGAEGTIKTALWVEQSVIITAGDDKCMKWWDLRTADKLVDSITLDGPISQMEERKGSVAVAAGSAVYVFDGLDRTPVKKQALDYNASTVSIHPSRKKFATGSANDTWVRIHDFSTGAVLDTLKAHHGPVHSISYSPDGQLCASGGEDGTIRLWKSETGPYGLWK